MQVAIKKSWSGSLDASRDRHVDWGKMQIERRELNANSKYLIMSEQ